MANKPSTKIKGPLSQFSKVLHIGGTGLSRRARFKLYRPAEWFFGFFHFTSIVNTSALKKTIHCLHLYCIAKESQSLPKNRILRNFRYTPITIALDKPQNTSFPRGQDHGTRHSNSNPAHPRFPNFRRAESVSSPRNSFTPIRPVRFPKLNVELKSFWVCMEW